MKLYFKELPSLFSVVLKFLSVIGRKLTDESKIIQDVKDIYGLEKSIPNVERHFDELLSLFGQIRVSDAHFKIFSEIIFAATSPFS